MRPIAIILALAAGSLTAAPALAQHAQHSGPAHIMMKPDELKWADVPTLPPGAKIAVIEGPLNHATPFTFRLRLPANYQIPAHSHPAIERVTVLSGTFHLGTGDKFDKAKTVALPAGSITIMQPGMNHFVWIAEETVVQLNGTGPWGITYVNPDEDPRKKS